jgi:hypothetical protein
MADVVTDFREAGQAGQRDTPKGVCPDLSHPCVRDKCPIVSRPCPMSRYIRGQCSPMFNVRQNVRFARGAAGGDIRQSDITRTLHTCKVALPNHRQFSHEPRRPASPGAAPAIRALKRSSESLDGVQ